MLVAECDYIIEKVLRKTHTCKRKSTESNRRQRHPRIEPTGENSTKGECSIRYEPALMQGALLICTALYPQEILVRCSVTIISKFRQNGF
jgi:hypothetical protein